METKQTIQKIAIAAAKKGRSAEAGIKAAIKAIQTLRKNEKR